MRHYVIATHGMFAEGIYSSLEIIAGQQKNVHRICAYLSEESLQQQIADVFQQIPIDEEVIVFTDLFGGSVNNEFMTYQRTRKLFLVTGMNLPMILSIVMNEGEDTDQVIRQALLDSKEGIKYCNDELTATADEDF